MKCSWCEQEMERGVGCTVIEFSDFKDGITRARIPYSESDICHDCGCPCGQYHHPGCDMERCPRCGGQSIACFCTREDWDSLELIKSVEVTGYPISISSIIELVAKEWEISIKEVLDLVLSNKLYIDTNPDSVSETGCYDILYGEV